MMGWSGSRESVTTKPHGAVEQVLNRERKRPPSLRRKPSSSSSALRSECCPTPFRRNQGDERAENRVFRRRRKEELGRKREFSRDFGLVLVFVL
ncbi:hypothetical protein SDJN03_18816, partial [Cucurbita argyrosperma subsp. sororia]